MKFLIISHVLHKKQNCKYFAYEPYMREMNLWLKHVSSVTVIAPIIDKTPNAIELDYKHTNLKFKPIPAIQFTSLMHIFLSVLKIPYILSKIFIECLKTDHIHLRCPGTIGLLGCVVQICFPKKIKTAKYAGNWDPNAIQPLSYNVQKWILSNTFLTRNMKVLVYSHWKNQSKNIKPFFTATYNDSEIKKIPIRDYSGPLQFLFVGSLVDGKRPLYAIKLIEALHEQGKIVVLDIFGEGILMDELQDYLDKYKLDDLVTLHGNRSKEVIKKAFKNANFVILPSKSEGWPKAIAEAMFFGVIPIVTPVSCVPDMLNYGLRGIIIKANLNFDLIHLNDILNDIEKLKMMSKSAAEWSQLYTLDSFEKEIVNLLK